MEFLRKAIFPVVKVLVQRKKAGLRKGIEVMFYYIFKTITERKIDRIVIPLVPFSHRPLGNSGTVLIGQKLSNLYLDSLRQREHIRSTDVTYILRINISDLV